MPTSRAFGVSGNRILDRLPSADRLRLEAASELIPLAVGDVLHDFEAVVRTVVFPCRGLVALFARVPERRGIGVGFVRADGVVSVAADVPTGRSPLKAIVLRAGEGRRIEIAAYGRLLKTSPTLALAVAAYGAETETQLAQNIACNAFHSARQRIARWVLDASGSDSHDVLMATQSSIADSLGLQRPAVSRVTSAFRREGLLSYVRGRVTVSDRRALRAVACTCSSVTTRSV